jgi:hypothetical protein
MLNLIAQFTYLQILDVLTSLAFMANGVREANPIVGCLTTAAGSALIGLVAAKAIALLLGWYCWRSRRQRLLSRVNLFYAGLVAWNLVAFLLSTATPLRT